MKAFHNDKKIKEYYLARVRAHAQADEIIKGTYWEGGKGCAVGCTIHSGKHSDYESELGIPEFLARLEDRIFENLPNEQAMTWPIRFLESIEVGADLSSIEVPFKIYILEKNLEQLEGLNLDAEKYSEVISSIRMAILANRQVIETLRSGKDLDMAWSAAWSAAESAESAASAASAARSAWSAAESAAWSAESAAESAASAASAARSAASAARSAWSAAESAAWTDISEKLLELMRECR